ncbi:hypothetical protein RGQ29_010237 [Quercus rubra]|uniref:Uncharacterized protein n=1 Tax=Quercus rubra TaxID=3512 RepID=A0AAN7G2K7_QUERU|nr:hypothetical protein RGQ29_010237 [Quercus rubra]
MARLSTHICHDPSFLGVSKAGMAQGLRLSLMCPFNNKSSTCLLSSSCSFGLVRWCGRLGRLEPSTRSIWCCISRSGSNPSSRSLGNTLINLAFSLCRLCNCTIRRSYWW